MKEQVWGQGAPCVCEASGGIVLSLVARFFEHFKDVDEQEQPSENGRAPDAIIGIWSIEFPTTSAFALDSFIWSSTKEDAKFYQPWYEYVVMTDSRHWSPSVFTAGKKILGDLVVIESTCTANWSSDRSTVVCVPGNISGTEYRAANGR